jgi:hypothetical protein
VLAPLEVGDEAPREKVVKRIDAVGELEGLIWRMIRAGATAGLLGVCK